VPENDELSPINVEIPERMSNEEYKLIRRRKRGRKKNEEKK